MISFMLLMALQGRQDPAVLLPPTARAMLDRFTPPRAGAVSVDAKFSRDTVWMGQQVELVTAAWFPRDLLHRLRRQPSLHAPSLSGLWSVQGVISPVLAASRWVGSTYYDLYVAHQTIFPLGAGRIESPPAVLTYGVPTSSSYFAPEERKTLTSKSEVLVVRPIPAALASTVGSGPTARGMHLAWRGPAQGLRAGSPAIVELAVSGEGNVALWPTPEIAWPAGLRVYPERTEEHLTPNQGRVAGEKRFRFTVVADSSGVLTLPGVRYPYFDPVDVQAPIAAVAPFTLPVLPMPNSGASRRPFPIGGESEVPLATRFINGAWPLLVLIALLPPVILFWRRRKRPPLVLQLAPDDPELELRRLLGTPIDAGPDRVAAALRRRGVAREEAEHIRRWLAAVGRRRYGPAHAEAPTPPREMSHVLGLLRRGLTVLCLLLVAVPLRSQVSDAASRYHGGDYSGAAREFEAAARREPRAASTWRDLGSSRWLDGDDVGAAAAWLSALRLAPRDPLLGLAWKSATAIPAEVRNLAPRIPISRDELILVALLSWLSIWASIALAAGRAPALVRRARRIATCSGLILLACMVMVFGRWRTEQNVLALIRPGAVLRIAPTPASPAVSPIAPWSLVEIDARRSGWVVVTGSDGNRGWLPEASVAPIGRLD